MVSRHGNPRVENLGYAGRRYVAVEVVRHCGEVVIVSCRRRENPRFSGGVLGGPWRVDVGETLHKVPSDFVHTSDEGSDELSGRVRDRPPFLLPARPIIPGRPPDTWAGEGLLLWIVTR